MWLMPIQYKVHLAPLVTIPRGQIGCVFARRHSIGADSIAGQRDSGRQDVEGFLRNGGQRAPRRETLREGTCALNLVQFVVFTEGGSYYLPNGTSR